jgi:hypothetical protein
MPDPPDSPPSSVGPPAPSEAVATEIATLEAILPPLPEQPRGVPVGEQTSPSSSPAENP